MVLGPILDSNLRRGLVLSGGSLEPFLMRPISAVLWVSILLTFLFGMPPVQRAVARLFRRRKATPVDGD